jgi:hypothetical protein
MPSQSSSLEQDARSFAVAFEKYRYVLLALLTVIYALGAMANARSKPLWYDEIITVIAASAPDAASTWKLAEHVDAAPPLPHLMTHYAIQWFGANDVAIRVPAIAGFWIFCLCMFWFVRSRLGIFYGLAALLLPLSTQAYNYAFEARAYGLEFGFCGLALVAWQASTSSWPDRKVTHAVSCIWLAWSLIGALLCHYYAVMLYVPLGGAELYRLWKNRRIDWGIWAALAMGAAPLVWHVATIRAVVKGFSQTVWADAYPGQLLEFWENGLQPGVSFLVLALVFMALWAWKFPGASGETDKPRSLPPHEIVAGILFLTIPVFVMAAGVAVTHMFSSRYALLGLTGVVLLLPAMAARLAGGRALLGFLMLAICSLRLVLITMTVPPPRNPLAEDALLVQALREGPVVVADGQTYMQIWQYAPEPLRSNMIFLVDNVASVKYMAYNTAAIDAALTDLRRWAPLRVIEYRDFATPGKEFRVLQNPLKPGWLLEKVAADGGAEAVERYTNLRQLYRVRMKP